MNKPEPGQTIDLLTEFNWATRTDMYSYRKVQVIKPPPYLPLKGDEFVIQHRGQLRVISMKHVHSIMHYEPSDAEPSDPKEAPNSGVINFRSPKSGNTYQITFVEGHAVECSCPGFQYRGRCRHLREAEPK